MTPRRLIEPARLAGAALLHTQSDERLVDLARAGNDRAFEAIVSRYRRPLLRYCRRLLPPERAEDAVQQTFLNAYRAMGAGEQELVLRPWLYRIAHNSSLNLLRQNGWNHDEIDESLDGVRQPPQAVEEREQVREVLDAVKDLPERQRSAVVLRELEGRSYEEIALELGVTGGAVRQLLNRARTTLRAAATAITPFDLVSWAASRGVSDAPVAERIAELTAGASAGGIAAAAKFGTALVVAGAVVGGSTGAGPVPNVLHPGGGSDAGAHEAPAGDRSGAAGGAPGGLPLSGGNEAGDERRAGRDDDRRGSDDRRGDGERSDDDGDDSRDGGDDGSNDGDDDRREGDRSGPGGGDDGGDRSGSDSSGPGSGDDSPSGSGSSGSGSGSSGSGSGDSSGSGSSGSGSSGSGSGDSSGSGSSGSGSSGSGSGDDGLSSGSGSSGSGASGSGSTDDGVTSGSGTSGSGSSGRH
ncbi:MAG TPA: sigma-70 family RNA polymerase sigma factor [Thermoleophilaceae bacterium]|jgi:RNA polymerase sigma factor (sigma-70 family)